MRRLAKGVLKLFVMIFDHTSICSHLLALQIGGVRFADIFPPGSYLDALFYVAFSYPDLYVSYPFNQHVEYIQAAGFYESGADRGHINEPGRRACTGCLQLLMIVQQ